MKKYICEYYLKTNKKDESHTFKDLGFKEFFHESTITFPVERKAFLLGSGEQKIATKLVIHEV